MNHHQIGSKTFPNLGRHRLVNYHEQIYVAAGAKTTNYSRTMKIDSHKRFR